MKKFTPKELTLFLNYDTHGRQVFHLNERVEIHQRIINEWTAAPFMPSFHAKLCQVFIELSACHFRKVECRYAENKENSTIELIIIKN